jgi:hypothetical protein
MASNRWTFHWASRLTPSPRDSPRPSSLPSDRCLTSLDTFDSLIEPPIASNLVDLSRATFVQVRPSSLPVGQVPNPCRYVSRSYVASYAFQVPRACPSSWFLYVTVVSLPFLPRLEHFHMFLLCLLAISLATLEIPLVSIVSLSLSQAI